MKLNCVDEEKGSLALEQVLFIASVVTMSVGLFAFYGNIRDYFANISLATPPANIGALSPGGTGSNPNNGN